MVQTILKTSLESHKMITIMYQKGNSITRRNIEVKAIDGNKIKAYCHLRKQTRVFNLDNILAADVYRSKICH
ncbi:MAG: WYL domain-containing protein [Clostridia bacterium]|nr:WYL domain-containing protein [Clostridia bacterium]